MADYVLALDQGTTSSRAILFDRNGSVVSVAQKEFPQILPSPGHVEHDPNDIWNSQLEVAQKALEQKSVSADQVAAIGITNQRETTVLWDKNTGVPIDNAIVWQSRITAPICEQLKADGHANTIRQKTGLVVDAYFSGTKVKYLLDKHEGLRNRASKGEILFGTVDSFLIWKLTGGRTHVTDVSNASRTMLFNIHSLDWDDELLGILDVPREMLPTVKDSSEVYGDSDAQLFGKSIPIAGCAGDQQAAMFGQACFEVGSAKNTYGTGCFLLLNTGDKPVESKSNLLTTVGWKIGDSVVYALEGSVFVGGAVVQWLRDGLGIIKHSSDVETLAATVDDSDGVYIVPAFVGLGAPHWDPYARGTIIGITRGTTAAHIARAAVDSMAYQSRDLLEAMKSDSELPLQSLKVDGGASVNNALMQFQSDILDCNVKRPVVAETTALGAAYLAGLAVGFWQDLSDVQQNWQLDQEFDPAIDDARRKRLCRNWQRAVERSLGWETVE
ncbi:MAG: glycerol kinase GlpK [Planctomycetales bacterium]|nr:glycerol kinase GlpK [Planctomycetales bacterium]